MWSQQCSYAYPIPLMLWCRFNLGTCWGHEWNWDRDMSKVFFHASYYFKLLQWPLRAVAAAYSDRASHRILPWSQTTIVFWRASERAEESLLFICLWQRFGLKYNQGVGLLVTMYCWSSLNCAEAEGLQVTSFLRVWHWIPSHCRGQWHVLGPIHSPPFLHSWRQIAAQTSSQSLVISQVITFT